MRWFKHVKWKLATALIGLLFFLVFMIWIPLSASAYRSVLGAAALGPLSAKPAVDVTSTMTALQKEQLILQNKQLQQNNDRGFGAWLWSNAAAIVSSLLSTLVVVGGALIGFWQWRVNRDDTRTKESDERREAQDKELRSQTEERFKTAVTALGDEKESVQIGGAILLRSFLNEEDKEIYGRYYAQIFDLAVAYLRPSNTSLLTEDPYRIPLSSEDLPAPLPLTPFRQALIVVFREAFPLARQETSLSLDATGIQLDHAYLANANLKGATIPYSSLRKADFAFASLQKVYLRGSHLEGAIFVRAQLKDGNLTIAHLEGANFNDAQLEDANLGGTHLNRAHFEGAQLKGAKLGNAYLTGTNLRDADLSGANPEEAQSLKDTNFLGVKGLTREQLLVCKAKGAVIDEDTTMSTPDATASPLSLAQDTSVQTPPTPSTEESSPTSVTNGSSIAASQQSDAAQTPADAPAQAITLHATTDGSSAASQQDSES